MAGAQESTDGLSAFLRGRIWCRVDSVAIANVHAINISSARASSSDQNGVFAIPVQAGHRVRFQAVGYESKTIEVDREMLGEGSEIEVWLEKAFYDLPVVEVYPYQTFTEFKYAFLNFEDSVPELKLDLHRRMGTEPMEGNRPPGFGVVIPGPITFLYNQFSRRERAWREFLVMVEQEEQADAADRILSPEVIKQLTGLEDPEMIRDFLHFCGMTSEYILIHSEIEVYQRVVDCYRAYVGEGP